MRNKYIIRNCNVIYFNPDKTAICNDLMLECPCECKDRTDCLLKQIVDECYAQEKLIDETKETEPDFQYYYGRYIFAREILQLLDIEEIK